MDCFVIMPIGHEQLEKIWDKVYEPVIKAAGMVPKRIDLHEDGTLLQARIFEFITNAPMLICDLTNERPNCYFEVGFALGRNRHSNLIICCREDHNVHGPHFKAGNPKIHFDLQSYHVIWWEEEKLEEFRKELELKFQRRKQKVIPSVFKAPVANDGTMDRMESILARERYEVKGWGKAI